MAITASDWSQISPTNNMAPGALASAASVSPTTFLTVLSGNVAITTIVPPVPHSHMLAFIFAGTAGVAPGGNIVNTKASIANEAMLLVYNPTIAKYIAVG